VSRRRHKGTGSITQLRDGRWQARLGSVTPDGRKVRQAWYGRTREQAEARLIEALADRLNGLAILPGRGPTLAAHCESWLAGAGLRLRPRTLDRYRQTLTTHVLPTLGSLPLNRLEVGHVNRLLAQKQAAGLAPATVAGIRSALRASLSAAVRAGVLRQNVAALADAPRLPDPERPILTAAEAQRLLAAAETDPEGPLWVLALTSAARLGELLGLRWTDYNPAQCSLGVERALQRLQRRWLLVEPKTRRARRVIPLTPVAVAALERQRRLQAAAQLAAGRAWRDEWGGLIFTGACGEPRFGPAVARHLQRRTAVLGLPNVGFHGLRRTAASLLADSGVPIQAVGDYLGDSVVTTLKHYVRSVPGSRRHAADVLAATLAGTRSPG
jgi:integrase